MGVDPAIDVTTEQRETILALLEEHLPDTAAWIYGSRVKWTSRPQSDLDLVVFATPEQNSRVGDLREAFEEGNLPFRVDLFVWDAIPETFKEQIGAEHVVLVEAEEQGERDGWTSVQLGDTVDLLTGFPFKSDKYVNDPSAPRLLRGDNIGQGRLRWDGAKRWPQNETQSLNSYWLRGDDVVIAMDRPWIKAGLKFSAVRESDLPALLVQRVSRLRGNSRLNTRFLSYVIGGRDFTNYVLSVQTGTAVPHISARQIKEFEFLLPSLSEQRAIAHILGTLDDKIELNRRMNEVLEGMARVLFKSWFVDFDPVRAKMDGRDPGLPQHLADLFPNRLIESELGEIPEGWEVKTLRQCTHLTMGQSPPGHTYNEHGEGLPFFQGRSDFGSRYPSNRRFCSAPTRIAQPGDTLVSVRAPVGDINMAWDRCCIGRGVAALRHKSGTASFTYYYAWKIQVALREYEHTGTVFGAINKGQFEALLVIEPNPRIIDAFDSYAGPIDAKINSNTRESRVLVALRDTLLPKLISGKIRVPSHKQTGALV